MGPARAVRIWWPPMASDIRHRTRGDVTYHGPGNCRLSIFRLGDGDAICTFICDGLEEVVIRTAGELGVAPCASRGSTG